MNECHKREIVHTIDYAWYTRHTINRICHYLNGCRKETNYFFLFHYFAFDWKNWIGERNNRQIIMNYISAAVLCLHFACFLFCFVQIEVNATQFHCKWLFLFFVCVFLWMNLMFNARWMTPVAPNFVEFPMLLLLPLLGQNNTSKSLLSNNVAGKFFSRGITHLCILWWFSLWTIIINGLDSMLLHQK